MRGDLVTGYITPRQLQVWRLIALGRTTKEIATELGRSSKTVGNQRTDISRRLGTHNLADLTRKAIEHGVITVEVRPLQFLRLGCREYHVIPAAPAPAPAPTSVAP